MIKQMAMKHRHAADRRICKVHYHVNRTAIRNVRGIHPFRAWQLCSVHCVHQKMYLMEMHGMQLLRLVHYSPVLVGSYSSLCHRFGVWLVALTIDVKDLLVFRKCSHELWRGPMKAPRAAR